MKAASPPPTVKDTSAPGKESHIVSSYGTHWAWLGLALGAESENRVRYCNMSVRLSKCLAPGG